MATATETETSPASENQKRCNLNLKSSETEDTISTEAQVSSGGVGNESKDKTGVTTVRNSGVNDGGSVNDIQKKMKRAERFGMPVQLSEKEKRNSRAERFGTGSAADGLGSSKPSEAEELKRKARAERFGSVLSAPSDEEVKKKARLARFGSLPKTDSAEEEKKKARAIRFSQLDSVTKGNVKGSINEKAAISGNAGGGT